MHTQPDTTNPPPLPPTHTNNNKQLQNKTPRPITIRPSTNTIITTRPTTTTAN